MVRRETLHLDGAAMPFQKLVAIFGFSRPAALESVSAELLWDL